MKAIIIYFTGTYNTLFLANKIKNKLEEHNSYEVELFSININSSLKNIQNYDLIIFSYPIYAFNMPRIFEKYIKKIKILPGKKYIIAKQSGEPLGLNNSSSYKLINKIKKNKGILINEYHFLLPYNIHFRYEDNFIKELFNYNDKLLSIFYSFNSFIFKIQRLGGPINSIFYKVDYKKCIKCNLCINNCPTKNIEIINNKIKFHKNCEMCMRCSFFVLLMQLILEC